MDIQTVIPIVIGAIIIIAIILYMILNQKKKVQEWLLYAVSEAEKHLGAGTGQLKLRKVYDWYCAKFPILAAVLPFKVFSGWVDTALDTMRMWLTSNAYISGYIGKGGD